MTLPKIVKKKVNRQNSFPAILRRKKKFFCPLSRGGGTKGLSGLFTKKIIFLRLPLLARTRLIPFSQLGLGIVAPSEQDYREVGALLDIAFKNIGNTFF